MLGVLFQYSLALQMQSMFEEAESKCKEAVEVAKVALAARKTLGTPEGAKEAAELEGAPSRAGRRHQHMGVGVLHRGCSSGLAAAAAQAFLPCARQLAKPRTHRGWAHAEVLEDLNIKLEELTDLANQERSAKVLVAI